MSTIRTGLIRRMARPLWARLRQQVELLEHELPVVDPPHLETDPAVQTTMQPSEPTLNVLLEPMDIGPALMKPAGILKQTVDGWHGRAQQLAGLEAVAQKIEPLFGLADESFVRMNRLEMQTWSSIPFSNPT